MESSWIVGGTWDGVVTIYIIVWLVCLGICSKDDVVNSPQKTGKFKYFYQLTQYVFLIVKMSLYPLLCGHTWKYLHLVWQIQLIKVQINRFPWT